MVNNQEIWRPISGFEEIYEISNLGRVRSFRTRNTGELREHPVILHGGIYRRKNSDFVPYRYVILFTNDKKRVNRKIGDLVLSAFVGPRPKGMTVSHLNNDSFDDRLENLAWETMAENNARSKGSKYVKGGKWSADKIKRLIAKRGIQAGRRLTLEQAEEIRQKHLRGKQKSELAKEYGVSWTSIYRIIKKETHRP